MISPIYYLQKMKTVELLRGDDIGDKEWDEMLQRLTLKKEKNLEASADN
jgi:hypothetical protein